MRLEIIQYDKLINFKCINLEIKRVSENSNPLIFSFFLEEFTQSWTLNCRPFWYWEPLPLNNVVGVQRVAMVNVNSVATLFSGRGVKVYSFIVQDCSYDITMIHYDVLLILTLFRFLANAQDL